MLEIPIFILDNHYYEPTHFKYNVLVVLNQQYLNIAWNSLF